MVMAVDPSLVKLDTAQAGIPAPFLHTRALKPYGGASISWMSEDWKNGGRNTHRNRRRPVRSHR